MPYTIDFIRYKNSDLHYAIDIIPLIPDCVWLTHDELYRLLKPSFPKLKKYSLRVQLFHWTRKGWLVNKQFGHGKNGSRTWRRASTRFGGTTKAARNCLRCSHGFQPEHKTNWLCPSCAVCAP